MKKSKIIIPIIFIVLIALALTLYFTLRPGTNAGAKNITVEIIYDDVDKSVNIKTDEEYLSGALEQEKLIEGTESSYGLYITAVDGRTADEGEQEWWCITKGGEMLNTGADTTPIADGETYELTLTTGW